MVGDRRYWPEMVGSCPLGTVPAAPRVATPFATPAAVAAMNADDGFVAADPRPCAVIAAATNASVAIFVELSPVVCVGLVGVPVRAGDASGASRASAASAREVSVAE